MNKIKLGVVVLGALLIVTGFQNCSGDDLPTEAKDAIAQSSIAPLKLVPPQDKMGPNSTANMSASGGVPPYQFSIVSGPVTINGSGLVTSAGDSGPFVARVTDSKGSIAEGSMTVDAALAPVQADTREFVTAGTSSFVLPNFNSVTIEVWGAGGGGGGVSNSATAYDGQDGGQSSVSGGSLNLSALGGSKGTGCRITTSPNATPGKGGLLPTTGTTTNTAGGDASPWQARNNGNGTSTFTPSNGGTSPGGGAGGVADELSSRPGTAPGGGGSGSGYVTKDSYYFYYCLTGGGGAGAYLKSTYTPTGPLPVGSTLSIVVGAGGVAVTTGPTVVGGAGAIGKVKININ